MATGSWHVLANPARLAPKSACVALAMLLLVIGAASAQEVTTTYTYDELGRLITAESGAPDDTTRVSYRYDRAGNLLGRSVSNPVFADGFEAPANVAKLAPDARP